MAPKGSGTAFQPLEHARKPQGVTFPAPGIEGSRTWNLRFQKALIALIATHLIRQFVVVISTDFLRSHYDALYNTMVSAMICSKLFCSTDNKAEREKKMIGLR